MSGTYLRAGGRRVSQRMQGGEPDRQGSERVTPRRYKTQTYTDISRRGGWGVVGDGERRAIEEKR